MNLVILMVFRKYVLLFFLKYFFSGNVGEYLLFVEGIVLVFGVCRVFISI